jgi:hypothetical protein
MYVQSIVFGLDTLSKGNIAPTSLLEYWAKIVMTCKS